MWNIKQIQKVLGGKAIGTPFTKTMIYETILLLPDEITEYVARHVWFFSSHEEAWGYTFHGNDLKDKHFIFLSDELFRQEKSQIKFTILHEIGHIILKHENSIGRKQTQTEIKLQEREADQFAKKYLF
jgi:hypothetical protein